MYDGPSAVSIGGARAQVAGGLASTSTSTQATERLAGELEGAVNRLHFAIDRARNFADRMIGALPQNAIGKESPNRIGALGGIQDRVDQLHASLSTLESELERLNAI